MPTFDESSKPHPKAWEPEPLELPLYVPPLPTDHRQRDDETGEGEAPSGVIVIDLC